MPLALHVILAAACGAAALHFARAGDLLPAAAALAFLAALTASALRARRLLAALARRLDEIAGGNLLVQDLPGGPSGAREADACAERANRCFRFLADLFGEWESQTQGLVDLTQQLRELAGTDRLTGLANRARFAERLEKLLILAARTGRPVAVILADLDHFKSVNDTHGHAVGDLVLAAAAAAIAGAVREGDLAARWGGEEMADCRMEPDGLWWSLEVRSSYGFSRRS